MKTIINSILLVIFSSLFMLSCDDSNNDKEVMCTEQFEFIPVKVQYADETPVALDSYKVMWEGRDITEKELYSKEPGAYIILSDYMKDDLWRKNTEITVFGYLNGNEVFSETYKVGADDCHILYEDTKPLIITIERP